MVRVKAAAAIVTAIAMVMTVVAMVATATTMTMTSGFSSKCKWFFRVSIGGVHAILSNILNKMGIIWGIEY